MSSACCNSCASPGGVVAGRHVTLFRKWTTLTGAVASGYEYYSETLDVTDFDGVDLGIEVAALNGSVDADLEVSTDGVQWSKPGGGGHAAITTAGTTARLQLTAPPARYLRLVFHTFSATTDWIHFFCCGMLRNT